MGVHAACPLATLIAERSLGRTYEWTVDHFMYEIDILWFHIAKLCSKTKKLMTSTCWGICLVKDTSTGIFPYMWLYDFWVHFMLKAFIIKQELDNIILMWLKLFWVVFLENPLFWNTYYCQWSRKPGILCVTRKRCVCDSCFTHKSPNFFSPNRKLRISTSSKLPGGEGDIS